MESGISTYNILLFKNYYEIFLFECQIITLWNQSEERVLIDQNYSFHSGGVRGLEWLTKQTFASCSMDGSIQVCQTDRHEPLHSLFQEVNFSNDSFHNHFVLALQLNL